VRPHQNNFAGLGTTGGGVPGDSYPDVTTGVLAQIQHLVVYSGERIPAPVGPRTRLKQDDIIAATARVARTRPMTFTDLAGRWAADRSYGRSIDTIARLYAARYCPDVDIVQAIPATSPAARRPVVAHRALTTHRVAVRTAAVLRSGGASHQPPTPAAARPAIEAVKPSCNVSVASFGGDRTLLIRSEPNAGQVNLVALDVHAGFEQAMAASFIKRYAPDGREIERFGTRDAALARAHALCRDAGASVTASHQGSTVPGR
jgi:hypothetical protein